jgi:hypothetical protein
MFERLVDVSGAARLVAASLCLCLVACEREPPPPQASPPAEGAPVAKSPDRLPPGELMEGTESVFGFVIPKGMTYVRPTRQSVRITGSVDFDQLTDYVKARISVRHAEMFGDELRFPQARIRGEKDKTFELSITKRASKCILRIQETTRHPTTTGLTEAQRWEKSGLRPDGKLIDPKSMQ